ncbi:MAG: hypothetical protein K2O95_00950 [Clostridia bacterium]|nr:hypothetical protein [Clostridia bacterium]MDE7078667.1 hypothetical protein [Clostridia bacterium]
MTWNEFKQKVKDFFVGEKVGQADTSKYAEDEKALNDKLKEIADSYKPTYEPGKGYEDLSDLLPEKVEFEYREYEGDDEEGIKTNTSQKYNELLEADSKITSDKYDTKVGEVENKKQSASEESALKAEALDKKYEEVEKAIINGLIQRGLYNSSIKSSQTKANEDAKDYELKELSDDLNKKLSTYDAQIEKLRGEENVALEQLDLSYAQKIQNEIASLIEKRNKEIQSIDDYNNKLKEKELQYIEDRAKAIEEQLAQRLKDEQYIKALENKNGYAGEKAENYSQRYDLAFEFYNSMPKSVALQMINDNKQLQEYLGNYFGKLVTAIGKKD